MSEYYMTHTGAQLDDAINKVKNGYIDKTKVKHFATGVVNNLTAGQELSVTGIKDALTGEAFDVKGLIFFMHPSEATNFQTSGKKPAAACIYKSNELSEAAAICAVSLVYAVRIHPTTPNSYLTISGNSFSYQSLTDSMYGLMACAKWRWYAWG